MTFTGPAAVGGIAKEEIESGKAKTECIERQGLVYFV